MQQMRRKEERRVVEKCEMGDTKVVDRAAPSAF
jgi:hypothetical protein